MSYRHPSGEEFGGVIGRTVHESKPRWPEPKLKKGSPNVVLVVLDDTGFSHLGCYGSTIATPNIDALAAQGARFTSFHTTALCSPTRACLLTGRNHHAVGMRGISNFDTGYPNMRGSIPKSAATLAETLRDHGYATFATGKWHLAPRNPGVRPWAELSTNEKAFAARLQEAFAAMLEHTDHQIGRLIDFLKGVGQWENTLFLLLFDNGASQEGGATGVLDEMKWFNGMRENVDVAVERLDDIGGPDSHCNIPWGWARVGNTPLKWYKQNTHGGGVRDPLVVHFPGHLASPGGIRTQFCHAVDITPTILDVVGIPTPDAVAGVPQMPMHGVSLKPAFGDPSAKIGRKSQFFEMLGHRGIWKDGWKAVTRHEPGKPFDEDRWELYHLDEDFSESTDLAETEPERVREMIDLWWREAEYSGALPLDDRGVFALFAASRRPGMPTARDHFVYHPPVSHIVTDACPPVARGWRMVADIEHLAGHGDGALIARGSINSGFVLYIKNGRVHFDYNCFHEHTLLAANAPLAPGNRKIEVLVARRANGGADVTLLIDGMEAAKGNIAKLLFLISTMGMDIGRSVSPVNHDYVEPFTYGGRIRTVTFDIPSQEQRGEAKAQVRAAVSQQ